LLGTLLGDEKRTLILQNLRTSMCTDCTGKEAVFMRRYSGEKLCGRCFCNSLEMKARRTIAKYKMFDPTDKTMVAVSGGKDSLTLLHMIKKIEKAFPNTTLSALTIDEGIEGYRDEALRMAAKNCQKLGVKHVVTSFKEVYGYELDDIVNLVRKRGKKGLTPCSYCGVLRRKALNIAAREFDATKLATAHNLDDETQTLLLNIIHGDPFRIARSKPVLTVKHPKFVQRVKPLCNIPEKEIALYAHLKRIEFQTIPCPYAQTALREDIRKILNRTEEKYAGTKFTIFKSFERIRLALEKVSEEGKLNNCKICGEPTSGNMCKACLMLEDLNIL
jgi:uncharacterized protein (TIGR00269 family)